MQSWTTTLAVVLASILLSPLDGVLAGDTSVPGSVTFAFDGGTLKCTFGTSNPEQKSHVAMIVFPASVDAVSQRTDIPIKKMENGSVVLVSDAGGEFTQLTNESFRAWSKARIADMAGRRTSTAENAFVAAVVHTLSTGAPVRLWASDAQDALESGTWGKLFDSTLAEQTDESSEDPFGGGPFK